MTPSQLTTLKVAMLADANLTTYVTNGDDGAIANYYNSTGVSTLWRPVITIAELNNAIVWSEFAGLTVALQNTYLAMTQGGVIDSTQANIRGGFTTVFTGKSSLANLISLSQRTATKFEDIFTTTNVCSLFGYQVSLTDIHNARSA